MTIVNDVGGGTRFVDACNHESDTAQVKVEKCAVAK
jgi:hypothetical protein